MSESEKIPPKDSSSQFKTIDVLDNIKVKLPDFVEEFTDLWFWQVEAAFEAARITSDNKKYNIIIGQLPTRVMFKLVDLRNNPPTQGVMYETLKKRITEEFSDSNEAKLTKLFSNMHMGDRKPSQLLAEMRTKAAGTSVNDQLLKQLWQRNLPEQVRAIISSVDVPLAETAEMADRVAEAIKPTHEINVITPAITTVPVNLNTTENAIEQLQGQVNQILNYIKDSQSSRSGRYRSRSRSHGTYQRGNTPKRTFEQCWFHFKYGAQARKCTKPCNFHQTNNTTNNINQGNQ